MEMEKDFDVNELIEKGKGDGVITNDELLEAMDGYQNFDIDQIDKIYEDLESNGIEIIDGNGDFSDLENEVEQMISTEEIEKMQEGLAVDDPVRMYLKEIGKVPLLDPERELVLAKRMMQGDEKASCRKYSKEARRKRYGFPRSYSGGQPRTYEGGR